MATNCAAEAGEGAGAAFLWTDEQFRRIATRYDKLGATFFAFIKIAAVRTWLRSI
jgi:transposase